MEIWGRVVQRFHLETATSQNAVLRFRVKCNIHIQSLTILQKKYFITSPFVICKYMSTRSKIYRCDSNGAAMVAIDTLLTLMIFIVFIVFFSLHCLWSSWSSFSSLSPLSSLLQWLMVLEFVTNRWTYSHAMMLEMILHLRMETWILVWCYSTFSWVFDLW